MRIIFADSALGTTLGAIVQLIFFLVAAIGSLKLGASAGKFIGIATDPNRGPFNRLKKGRAAIVDSNLHKLKTGTRYSGNRFIPGSTALANAVNRTTAGVSSGTRGGFGLGTRRGRAAMGQLREAEGDRIRGSAQYAAIKENDDALRAGTYSNDAEAMAGLTQFFGGNRDRARNAIAAFHASGLQYSAGTQVAAAKGLMDTGTGYRDMRDMVETSARVSRGNRSAASSLAGYLNAKGKEKRYDLTPGHGELNSLIANQMSGAGNSQFEYDRMTVRGIRNSGVPTQQLATAKGAVWDNALRANNNLQAARAGALPNYGGDAAQYDAMDRSLLPMAMELKQANYSSGSEDTSNAINQLYQSRQADIAANAASMIDNGSARTYGAGGIPPGAAAGGGAVVPPPVGTPAAATRRPAASAPPGRPGAVGGVRPARVAGRRRP